MRPPTPSQLRYLRDLAERTGQTFAMPHTTVEASREIQRMRGLPRSSRAERQVERREVQREIAERPHDAAAVREHEVSGYGANATWSRTVGEPSAARNRESYARRPPSAAARRSGRVARLAPRSTSSERSSDPSATGAESSPSELEPTGRIVGRYRVSDGERVLVAVPHGDRFTLSDHPDRSQSGQMATPQQQAHYPVAAGLRARALDDLVRRYVADAAALDAIPMTLTREHAYRASDLDAANHRANSAQTAYERARQLQERALAERALARRVADGARLRPPERGRRAPLGRGIDAIGS
jgi:hypothetical protein